MSRIPRRLASVAGERRWLQVLLGAVVVGLLVSPLAVAAGEGQPILGGERNPRGSANLERETQIVARSGTYGTRQSNETIGNGGGAIYGCRSAFPTSGRAGTDLEPCIRANNLTGGRAFEFNSVSGNEAGRITVSNDGGDRPSARPFSTNATGVATGLNADRVDGQNASDLQAKFARVTAAGTLEGGRDATSATRTGEGTYDVRFGSSVSSCARTAEVQSISNAGTTSVESVDATTVRVQTRAAEGLNPPADRPFHLTVNC
jgi:hypothetical protein